MAALRTPIASNNPFHAHIFSIKFFLSLLMVTHIGLLTVLDALNSLKCQQMAGQLSLH
jgi:hypothetical protein